MKKVLIFARLGIMAFCFCCFFAWNPLKAQNESSLEQVPLPLILSKGPLIQQPPAISSWEINYFYASDPKQKSGETPTAALASPSKSPTPGAGLSLLPPQRVTLSYAAPSWHALTIDTSGISIEQWFNGNFRAVIATGFPLMLLRQGPPDPKFRSPYIDYGARKFPDLDWVSPATYAGVQSTKGHKWLFFQNNDQQAWIDLESRFPVQWRKGDETRTFRQLQLPVSPLPFPQEVQQLFAGVQHDLDLLHRPIPR
jgi:hypothetical protein